MLAIIAVYALLASTFVIAKMALAFAHPFFLIGVRMSVAGLCLVGFSALRYGRKIRIAREDRWTFLKIAFFHIYLAFTCEFWALQSLSSSKTNLIYTATPFVAALLSYFLLHERLSRKKIMGLALGLMGLIPVTLMGSGLHHFHGWVSELFPEAVLFVSVVSASYAWFDIKKMMHKGYSLVWINGFSMLLGGLATLTTTWITCGASAFEVSHPWEFIQFVGLMVVVSNFIFYNAYGWLMKRHSITFLTFAGFLSPVFGAIYGKLLLQESIHWNYAASLIIITLALYLFYREEMQTKIALDESTAPVPPESP